MMTSEPVLCKDDFSCLLSWLVVSKDISNLSCSWLPNTPPCWCRARRVARQALTLLARFCYLIFLFGSLVTISPVLVPTFLIAALALTLCFYFRVPRNVFIPALIDLQWLTLTLWEALSVIIPTFRKLWWLRFLHFAQDSQCNSDLHY